ncbi:something about silencing, SAS, complex subunit 4-domain-containing protein [Boeremia exigua]|uniref:something about silencing, SAS, complex subunit 4-domain-containing protein n=1 Tax=Boeremia exigua TaxID=749465 RepID=UPI001E8ED6D1|nr:something about silencing, SAS, complex subunit 4-domain-containing protein [Boeremia exigua]KAH6638157.1 something about silencing, SAS, complex subunit 4-domain-containing protein [Boeremia exigua]
MANLARPPMRSPTERLVQTRLNFQVAPQSSPHNTAVSTRRSSKSGPLVVLDDDEKTVEQLTASPARPAPPARTGSRKRPYAALDDADTRPPTKVVHRSPHGELVRITNGVQTLLDIDADDVPSGRSTPRPGSAGKLAVPVPAADSRSKDRRSLRSSDGGSRLKSDLAVYFSSYDDIIAGLPKPSEYLDVDTPIYIVDEPPKSKTAAPASPESLRKSASPARTRKPRAITPPRDPSNPPIPAAQSSTTFQVLDYSSIAKHIRSDGEQDPLADSYFFAQHRRAERKEKQLRNIEKERAMHEKQQLERLLDGLQGPDWLRVMGITGVTAGETRDWESKRDYFVKEVEALVDKFRVWKQEEKRIRAEKEAALAARTEDEDEEGEESEASEPHKVNGKTSHVKDQQPKEPEPPKPKRPPRPHGFLLPYIPPEPTTPFVSFYTKPHLRAAALGKHRHGRNATAFGQPIPEFSEHDFELPEDYIDPQFLRDNARQRRRRQRERQTGANTEST